MYLKLRMPVVLAIVILGCLLGGKFLPLGFQQLFYAISLTIKEGLLFILPLIIFSLLFSSIVQMSHKAFKLVLCLIPMVCLSNFLTTWVAYLSGHLFLNGMSLASDPNGLKDTLEPLWYFSLPAWIANEKAMFLGIITGGIASRYWQAVGEKCAEKLSAYSLGLLHRVFIPLMPIFILGFLIKLQYDDVLAMIVKIYAWVFLIIFVTQLTYIVLLFGIGAHFKLKPWFRAIRNIIPSVLTGFSTMSSAAALPFTLDAASQNTQKPEVAGFVVPTTVNIHLIGDCIAIPILAMAIVHSFGFGSVTLSEFMVFAVYFVMAKFAVAAVPGGGILVMLPILERHLRFDSSMLSLITALYVLFDSIITSMNVAGNGAFAILFSKFCSKLQLPSLAKEAIH